MANTNSDLVTKQAAALTDPSAGIVNGDDAFGVIMYATAKVTVPATPSTSDTLTIIPAELCPVGAVVVPQLCSVSCLTDPGTALNLDIGTPDNPDLFSDNLALTTAVSTGGPVSFAASGTVAEAIGTPYRFKKQEKIIATIVTSSSVAETVIVFLIAYRGKM